ncbi:MAG TPA: TraM recognition domain-containing protein [Terracidiphilus sp.]|nr:TraM recognition domain-containing protein [Terracidiphilus sp.]
MPLTARDNLTLHQAFEGILGIGGTGSGKTSTLLHLMLALMLHQCGMLFLTSKKDDYEMIARIARMAGREADLRRFAQEESWRFDFLNYELSSPGGSVQTAGQLMQDLMDFSTRTNTMNTNEPFWPIVAGRRVNTSLNVVYKAKGACSVANVYDFYNTLPRTPEQRESEEFRSSYCFECLKQAVTQHPNDPDLSRAVDQVLKEIPHTSDRTNGCIDAYVYNLISPFLHGSVRDLIASGGTNLSPADLDTRKLIVIDMPVLVGREPYQLAQMVWKLSTQRHALRRPLSPQTLDLGLWCDEAHLHALPSVDSMVQAVARSHKLIQVAITQNIPLLESVLKRREDVLAWISNLQTKFIFANGDKDTNEYFSGLLGQSKQLMGGASVPTGKLDPLADWWGTQRQEGSYSMNEHWLPDVRQEDFTRLRKGGKEFDYTVDFYCWQGGRRFSNGKTWIKTALRQMV